MYQTPPNGEPIESLLARTNEFLEDLKTKEDLQDKTILISSHGAAVRALLSNIEKVIKKYLGTKVGFGYKVRDQSAI